MSGFDKKKLTDIFKKKDEEEVKAKATAKPTVKKTVKKTTVKKSATKPKGGSLSGMDASKMKADSTKLKARIDARRKHQEEVLNSKTHQDLINVAYKVAEKIKIAPWVLLRAAKWGHFTDERSKMYDGPILDDIKTLEPEQRDALKEELGVK